MSIVLIGYRGCGKTTIGRRLADRLWWPFVDTDDIVMKKVGKSIADIFEQHGEKRFRELEAEAVKEAAKLQEHVIALGGGAVLRKENVDIIRKAEHKVVYLKCDPTELYKRIQADPNTARHRPKLTPVGGLEEITSLLHEREPLYRAAMTAELDVTNQSASDAVVYIARLV
jgi:shikimate kinase